MNSSRSEKNGERHEVHCSGKMAKVIRDLQRQAAIEGRGDEFLVALRQIWRQLRRDPVRLGDPLYDMPAMRLRIRHGVIRPILIHFAVSDDESLVFIKGIKLPPRKST
jgi:hypothetical protein